MAVPFLASFLLSQAHGMLAEGATNSSAASLSNKETTSLFRGLHPPPPGPPRTEATSLLCPTKPQGNSWPLQLTSPAPGKGGKRPGKELALGQGVNVSVSLHRCLFGHLSPLSSHETPPGSWVFREGRTPGSLDGGQETHPWH